jgi:hypothetical protein
MKFTTLALTLNHELDNIRFDLRQMRRGNKIGLAIFAANIIIALLVLFGYIPLPE